MHPKRIRWSDEVEDPDLIPPPLCRAIPHRPRLPIGFDTEAWLLGVTDGDNIEITDHNSALRFLDTTHNDNTTISDDYIIALAAAKKAENDSTSQQEKVNKAVRLVADQRNSAALHAWLATGEATSTDDDEVAAAYRFFDIKDRSADISVDTLELHVQLIINDDGESADRKAKANRYLELLRNQHKTAPVSTMKPDYTRPVGLVNNRNYCYLHALLQYFYAIKPFRETIINFLNEYQQPVEDADEADLGKLAGSLIRRLQVEDGHVLVPQLSKLFEQLQSAPGPNITASEAMAAECLNSAPFAPTAPPSENADMSNEAGGKSPSTVQGATPRSESSDGTLVGDIMTPDSDSEGQQKDDGVTSTGETPKDDEGGKLSPPDHPPPPVPPRPNADTEASAEYQYKQQDAHEVAGKIIERTINAIKPTSIDSDGERHDSIRDLFYMVTQPIPTEDSKVQTKFQPDFGTSQFMYLQQKPKDIQECLDIALGRSSTSDTSDDRIRYTVMKTAPQILQLYMSTYEVANIDPNDKKSAVTPRKVWPYMELNDIIHLDRYMEENQPAILHVRQRSWDIRDQLNKLEAEKKDLLITGVRLHSGEPQDSSNQSGPSADIDVGDALGSLIDLMQKEADGIEADAQPDLPDLKALAEEDRERVAQIDREIPVLQEELSHLPLDRIDSDGLKYRLFAAFMYQGVTTAGHWFIYIRDFKNNVWRKYNDATISEVQASEILGKRGANDPSAPLVAYIREDLVDHIDPVHRIAQEGDVRNGGDADVPMVEASGVEVHEVEMKSLLDD